MAYQSDQSTLYERGESPYPTAIPDMNSRPQYQEADITPYLGLRARLSQTWINKWTVLIFLVLVRTLIAVAGFHSDLQSAQREALAACRGVEAMGSAMASAPHYLAAGVNEFTIDGVEKAVSALMTMLNMSITGVEEIVVFVINMMTNTYLCLITMAVSGSLHAGINIVDDASGWMNNSLTSIGDDLSGAVDDFESEMNKFIDGLNDVGHLLGVDTVPSININGSIDQLRNMKLPSDFTADLQKLNDSIPSFSQVQNFTNTAIRFPFEEIKKLIAEHQPNYTLDDSWLPVPAKEQLQFCSNNSGVVEFFDDLIDVGILFRKIALVVLLLLAIGAMVPMAYREMRRYRFMQSRAQIISSQTYDSMDSVYIVSRPYTASAGMKLAQMAPEHNNRGRTLIRWAVAYATTIPALFVLSLGLAGLFSCLCQYILLKAVEKEVPKLVQEVVGFAEKVVGSLENSSTHWSNGTNTAILSLNNDINSDVFGWVNISTHALNNTLNIFVEETTKVLNDTFGGTILYDPITEIFNCLIGLKVLGLEKGLTWISDHAHIDFPLLPNNTFSLGAAASISGDSTVSSFLQDPGSMTGDGLTEAVNWLTGKLADGIRTEAIISLCVVGVWVLIALIGIVRAALLWFGKGKALPIPGIDARSKDGRDGQGKDAAFLANMSEKYKPQGQISEKQGPFVQPTLAPAPPPTAPPPTAPLPNPPPAPPVVYASTLNEKRRPSTTTTAAEAGNTYKGHSYTLNPHPMPKFSTSGPDEEVLSPGGQESSNDGSARFGLGGAKAFATTVKTPGQWRKSSRADMNPGVASRGRWD